ncbi:MAG: hypothetical protein V3U22_03875, partial [Vicinamibacteria bacterium]
DRGHLRGGGRGGAQSDASEKELGASREFSHGTLAFWPENLEGDLALVLQVLGEIDRRHPTATKFTFDAVAVGKSGG